MVVHKCYVVTKFSIITNSFLTAGCLFHIYYLFSVSIIPFFLITAKNKAHSFLNELCQQSDLPVLILL